MTLNMEGRLAAKPYDCAGVWPPPPVFLSGEQDSKTPSQDAAPQQAVRPASLLPPPLPPTPLPAPLPTSPLRPTTTDIAGGEDASCSLPPSASSTKTDYPVRKMPRKMLPRPVHRMGTDVHNSSGVGDAQVSASSPHLAAEMTPVDEREGAKPASATSASSTSVDPGIIVDSSQGSSLRTTVALHGLCDLRLVDLVSWPEFFEDMQLGIRKECQKHGEVTHICVDKTAPLGSVYVRFAAASQAEACCMAMHKRNFAGRRVTAETHGNELWN